MQSVVFKEVRHFYFVPLDITTASAEFVFYLRLLIGILYNVIQSNSVDPVTQTLSFFLNFFHIGINVAVWSQV